MAEKRVYRAEAVIPYPWQIRYRTGLNPEKTAISSRREFLGYFSYNDAIKVVAENINDRYYEKPKPPGNDAGGGTIEFHFISDVRIPSGTRRNIIHHSLVKSHLSIQQAAELNIEFANLEGGVVPTYSSNLTFLGFYAREYATRRWGKARKSDRVQGKFVVKNRVKDDIRYDLLSSQVLAPNHEALGEKRLQTLALALRPLVLEKLGSGLGSASDLTDFLHLIVGLNGTVYSVSTKSGSFVGHFKESRVLELWGDYTPDDDRKVILLGKDLPDEERAQHLREEFDTERLNDGKHALEIVDALAQLGDDVDDTIVRTYSDSLPSDSKASVQTIPRNSDWRSLFRRVRACIDAVEHDPVAGGKVLGKIRSEFGDGNHGAFISATRRAFASTDREICILNGMELGPEQVLTLALVGHREATALLTEALLIEAEGGIAERNSRKATRERYERNKSVEDLPEWAKPERAFLLEWSEKTMEKEPVGLIDDIAHFIAKRIKKGGVNVLVFDAELYSEVTGADIVGKGTGGIEEFPFPMTIVRMTDTPGVYGIAVFLRQEFRKAAVTEFGKDGKYSDGYEVAYILSNGGITLEPSTRTASVGEKLTTYLDCDNAMIEVVYVDGGTSGRRNNPRPKAVRPEYVRGADFIVGTQVVTERERQSRGAKKIIKRAHFRRGFYKRQRVGPRDAWHYETRWIKPTFVHGSESIVTERRVKRLLL